MLELTLHPINAGAWRVMHSRAGHVGNLKLAGGVWKFKAIGYDPTGDVIPGGGPLTDRHNTAFATPDAAAVNAALGTS